MQSNLRPHFLWSDAWLLLAIALTDDGNGASLRRIIGAGDYINHAVFSDMELKRGLVLLAKAGYIYEQGSLFFISGEAKEFWQGFWRTHKSIHKLVEAFTGFLGVAEPGNDILGDENAGWQFPGLSDEAIHHAVEDYYKGNQTS
jgi:hypothetical protein